jgi:hypothetical protein
MLKAPVRLPSVIFFVFSVLLTLFAGVGGVCGYNNEFEEEQIRRAAKQLVEVDRALKEKARQRNAALDRKDNDDGGFCCVGIIIVIVIGAIANANKKKEQEAAKDIEADCKQEEELLFDEPLNNAKSFDFTFDNETKVCPACAETIKLAAKKCRFCGEVFDPDKVEAMIAECQFFESFTKDIRYLTEKELRTCYRILKNNDKQNLKIQIAAYNDKFNPPRSILKCVDEQGQKYQVFIIGSRITKFDNYI